MPKDVAEVTPGSDERHHSLVRTTDQLESGKKIWLHSATPLNNIRDETGKIAAKILRGEIPGLPHYRPKTKQTEVTQSTSLCDLSHRQLLLNT
jgi:hypothetical protein